MNIIYIEDSGSALYKIDELEEYEGHVVYNSEYLADIGYWLEEKPGASKFGALIFDLVFDNPLRVKGLESLDLSVPYEPSKHPYPSLHVIKHYVLRKFPRFKGKIILCSAFFDTLEEDPEIKKDLENYELLNKKSPSLNRDLINALRRMEGRRG